MPTPAANWNTRFEGVEVFHDAQDRKLIHYGPRVTWTDLRKSSLGGRFTLLQGEVQYGHSPVDLDRMAAHFPGFRLAPLMPKDVRPAVACAIPIESPHTLRLSTILSAPFPTLSFNATIAHSDPAHARLIEEIESRWTAKTILTGGVEFHYDMRDVRCGYNLSLKPALVAAAVSGELPGGPWSRPEVARGVREAVAASPGWMASSVPAGYANGLLPEVKQFAAQLVESTYFEGTTPIVRFDSGEAIVSLRMRDPSTVGPQDLLLISSREVDHVLTPSF